MCIALYLLGVIFHSSWLPCVFSKDQLPDVCLLIMPPCRTHTCYIPLRWRSSLSPAGSQYKGPSGLLQVFLFLSLDQSSTPSPSPEGFCDHGSLKCLRFHPRRATHIFPNLNFSPQVIFILILLGAWTATSRLCTHITFYFSAA